MKSHFHRIVALLLAGCLAGGVLLPAGAATFEIQVAALAEIQFIHSIQISGRPGGPPLQLFATQALAEPAVAETRIGDRKPKIAERRLAGAKIQPAAPPVGRKTGDPLWDLFARGALILNTVRLNFPDCRFVNAVIEQAADAGNILTELIDFPPDQLLPTATRIIDLFDAYCREHRHRNPTPFEKHLMNYGRPLWAWITPRQRQLGVLNLHGFSHGEIANELKISIQTVKNHFHAIIGSRALTASTARRKLNFQKVLMVYGSSPKRIGGMLEMFLRLDDGFGMGEGEMWPRLLRLQENDVVRQISALCMVGVLQFRRSEIWPFVIRVSLADWVIARRHNPAFVKKLLGLREWKIQVFDPVTDGYKTVLAKLEGLKEAYLPARVSSRELASSAAAALGHFSRESA